MTRITVLIFSACMPFMVFTYWLRGIDLPSIFVLLVFCFLVVAATVQLVDRDAVQRRVGAPLVVAGEDRVEVPVDEQPEPPEAPRQARSARSANVASQCSPM